MSVRIYKEPALERPVLVAGWPGIGSIGLLAVDTMRRLLGAEEFGEIEPWEFFYPKRALIRNGELAELEFPSNKFYFARPARYDLIFFIGEEQPTMGRTGYGEGRKAYELASLVMDVAEDFNCSRVYTSGAAVAPIHHTSRPRVWGVPNHPALIDEVRKYPDTVLMSDIEGRNGQGSITGLNGLLLGVAQERGIEAICLMGEIPSYLHEIPFPYPKASRSVLEVFGAVLGVTFDLTAFDAVVERAEREIQRLYDAFPAEVREQLDRLKYLAPGERTGPGPITEEDKKSILDEVERLFKRKPKEEESA
ncbi:MAG: PAC2 family protein [Dehalococcoidia bacterium]|nr:PAC2 family protein [Dehalococcoidia bacterium]